MRIVFSICRRCSMDFQTSPQPSRGIRVYDWWSSVRHPAPSRCILFIFDQLVMLSSFLFYPLWILMTWTNCCRTFESCWFRGKYLLRYLASYDFVRAVPTFTPWLLRPRLSFSLSCFDGHWWIAGQSSRSSSFLCISKLRAKFASSKTVVNYIHSRDKITVRFWDRNSDGLLFRTELSNFPWRAMIVDSVGQVWNSMDSTPSKVERMLSRRSLLYPMRWVSLGIFILFTLTPLLVKRLSSRCYCYKFSGLLRARRRKPKKKGVGFKYRLLMSGLHVIASNLLSTL